MMTLTFQVLGKPQPAGSKKAFVNSKTNKAVIVDDAKGSRPWKQEVAQTARDEKRKQGLSDETLIRGACEVELHFSMNRPRGHYGTGRNVDVLRRSAPAWPTVKPDVDKLSRACLDALTGVIWADDALVVRKVVTKSYAAPEGVLVIVRPLLASVGAVAA